MRLLHKIGRSEGYDGKFVERSLRDSHGTHVSLPFRCEWVKRNGHDLLVKDCALLVLHVCLYYMCRKPLNFDMLNKDGLRCL